MDVRAQADSHAAQENAADTAGFSPAHHGTKPSKAGARAPRRLALQRLDGTWALPGADHPAGLTPTDIEWADYAFNPLRAVLTRDVWMKNGIIVEPGTPSARVMEAGRTGWACAKKSEGCGNCYSESLNVRWGTGLRFHNRYLEEGIVRLELDARRVDAALRHRVAKGWRSKSADGRPKVFVADMTDLFSEAAPFEVVEPLLSLFAARSDVDWMLLTKRPERMAEFFGGRCIHPNIWVGASVENQEWADRRLGFLRRCNAAVRFLSCEPLLGPVPNLELDGIGWVIVGGESGSRSRPCDLDWVRDINRQCVTRNVPCFNKQLGTRPVQSGGPVRLTANGESLRGKGGQPESWPDDLRLRQWPNA